jgi:hypothetical protein
LQFIKAANNRPQIKKGAIVMEEKNLMIILASLRNAKDIIGLAVRPYGATGCNSFEDTEIRDMYYAINEMCIRIDEKIEEKKKTDNCG